MNEDDLLEAFAKATHDQWSHWMNHMFTKCREGGDGSLVISNELVNRWARQASTEYECLPEKEKASDRVQAMRYLYVVSRMEKQ